MYDLETFADFVVNTYRWKVHEACMLALGSLKDLIIQKIRENCLQFDITGFIRNVVVEDLNSTGNISKPYYL